MKKFFLLLIAAACVASGQAQKTINDPNAEVRNVSGFHAIKISSAIDLLLTQSSTEAVVVSASEPKYRDRIKTEIDNGMLRIYVEQGDWKWWKNSGNQKLKAYVSFKTLDKLIVSGACDVNVEGVIKSDVLTINLSGASDFDGEVDASTLTFDQSGASDATVWGRADKVKIDVSGASVFKGFNLKTENCSAKAQGASDVKITVNKELEARATGASSIRYSGSAVVTELHSSGASSVSKKG
jgi:hypothetical protein